MCYKILQLASNQGPLSMDLRPGDIFCTINPMALGKAINFVQKVWSGDDQAIYSHAGIITSEEGDTLEALWTVKQSNLSKYKGKQVLIGRHRDMTPAKHNAAIYQIKQRHEGQWYPIHRLIFHLIPPLAKYIHFSNHPVCSELAAMYLVAAKFIQKWAGKTPDYIADMITKWFWWEIVFEGEWK